MPNKLLIKCIAVEPVMEHPDVAGIRQIQSQPFLCPANMLSHTFFCLPPFSQISQACKKTFFFPLQGSQPAQPNHRRMYTTILTNLFWCFLFAKSRVNYYISSAFASRMLIRSGPFGVPLAALALGVAGRLGVN